MKQRWLLIDDNKRWQDVLNVSTFFGETLESEYPGVEFFTATSFEEGCQKLQEGNWDRVDVDHELGGRGDETGIDILKLLEQKKFPLPKEMRPCSGHSGRKMEMYKMIQALYPKPS